MIEDFCKLSKTPSNGTCFEEPPGGFRDVGYCCCFISLEVFHSLRFDVIVHPSASYRRVFTPILYFQPSSSQSDLRHFHFQPFQDLLVTVLPRALQFWVGIFYPRVFFTLGSFTDILSAFIKERLYPSLPGSRQFFLDVCRASIKLILETQTRPICLCDS